ncbi:MAG: hypothetical protein JSW60_08915 [Thermoplasmatales archaeon]|nr:MAG: hypothetical protein JSW60_08915 [Thermoplasmatales archaeon]
MGRKMGFFKRKTKKNNIDKGEIYDTAHMSVDTTAIVFSTFLGKNPNSFIVYHVRSKAVLERFINEPILSGININVINLENISSNPFKNGINIFDTPVLFELVKKGKFSYLRKNILHSDDYHKAIEATGWNLCDELGSDHYGIHKSKEA